MRNDNTRLQYKLCIEHNAHDNDYRFIELDVMLQIIMAWIIHIIICMNMIRSIIMIVMNIMIAMNIVIVIVVKIHRFLALPDLVIVMMIIMMIRDITE